MNTYSRFNKIAYAIALVLMVVCFAMVDSASASAGGITEDAYTVPTSLCYDPLLGMSFVIYNDCGQGESVKHEKDNTVSVMPVQEQTNSTTVIVPDVVKEEPVVIDTVSNDSVPEVVENDPVDDTGSDSKPDKIKNNNGHGNNEDGVDCSNPGNGKPVGNAGEKCDKGMCENEDGTTGEHGKSNKD